MRSTIVGPYPRVSSECGDRLRREINRLYAGFGDAEFVQSLRRNLTREVVREMISAGIDLPNYGLVDIHDELTWPLEYVSGVRFGGMKKTFHTNTHYRVAVVDGEIARRHRLTPYLYEVALEVYPEVKIEFPGPYTMARHSVVTEESPYRGVDDLVEAYAKILREELCDLKGAALVQFNEPSMIAPGTRSGELRAIPDLYSKMLSGLRVPVAVWTFYGKYSSEVLEILLSLPVDIVGFDFVWDPEVDTLLKEMSPGRGIGIGLIDSGDRGLLRLEDPKQILGRLSSLEDYVDLERSYVSSNATLEHLPRDYAKKKIRLMGEITERFDR